MGMTNMRSPSRRSAPEPSVQRRYLALCLWSAGLTLVLVVGLLSVHRFDHASVLRLRNFLGYGHFALAYVFTWRLIRRQLGSRLVAVRYVGLVLLIVALYAAAQRWWVSAAVNDLFIMVLFMIHHASNEVLFREQGRNGNRPFPWTSRRVAWVALAVGLVFVDRTAAVLHGWHAAFPAIAAAWAGGWAAYGWRCFRAPHALWPRAGWLCAGAFVARCALQPATEPFFATQHKFAWIVIYHYLIWYVFYTRKLLARTGGWSSSERPSRSLAVLWRYATTVPGGFLTLVAIGNLSILAVFVAADPLADWVTAATRLDFFQLNTVAHILFGVGIPQSTVAPSAARLDRSAEPAAQFA